VTGSLGFHKMSWAGGFLDGNYFTSDLHPTIYNGSSCKFAVMEFLPSNCVSNYLWKYECGTMVSSRVFNSHLTYGDLICRYIRYKDSFYFR